jgi:hypothetical protein
MNFLLFLPIFAAIEVLNAAAQSTNTTAITWNTIVLAIINVIGIGITSFVALTIAKINNNSVKAVENTQSTKEISEATAKQTKEIGDRVVEIHTVTNGNLSKLEAALGISAEKLTGMQKLITEMMLSSKDKDVTLARVRTERDGLGAAAAAAAATAATTVVATGPIVATGPVVRPSDTAIHDGQESLYSADQIAEILKSMKKPE